MWVIFQELFFHHQQWNAAGDSFDGLCQSGLELELTDPTTLTQRHPNGNTNWGINMHLVTWVIWNDDITFNQTMIVEHVNPIERRDGDGTGDPEEDVWELAVNTLSYDISETAITGMTAQSAGCGTAYPRGSIGAMLLNDTAVEFTQSDYGQPQEHAFQVTQFPRLEKCVGGDSSLIDIDEWTMSCITYDYLDPGIVNPNEAPEILTKLQHPIFANGFLQITMSTDNGEVDSQTRTVV